MPPESTDRISRLIRSFIGFQVAFTLLFWLPVFYSFQKKLGLTDREILGIQSFYYVAFCLFELPTGMLADRLGRRLCARIGAVLLLVANIVPVLAAEMEWGSTRQIYWGMMLHFLLIAAARSFVSGAASAYLFDALRRAGRESEYAAVEGRARALGLTSRILGWLGVGALMQLRLSLPYLLTIGSGALAFWFAWRMPEGGEARDDRDDGKEPLPGFLDGLRHVVGDSRLALTMAQGIGIFVMDRISLVNLFQPILAEKNFALWAAGPMLAWVSFCEAWGNARVKKFRAGVAADWSLRGILVVLTATMGLSLGWIGWAERWSTIALFTVYSLAAGLAYPLQRLAMNEAIPDSRMRATLISVESIIDRTVCAVIAWVLGGFLERRELDLFLHGTGLVTLLFCLGVFVLGRLMSGVSDVSSVKPDRPGSPSA